MTTYRDPVLKYLSTRISWLWTASIINAVLEPTHTDQEADELFERLKALAKGNKIEHRIMDRRDGSSGSQWRLRR